MVSMTPGWSWLMARICTQKRTVGREIGLRQRQKELRIAAFFQS